MALLLWLPVNRLTSARTEPSVHHPPPARAKGALGVLEWWEMGVCAARQAGIYSSHIQLSLESWVGQKRLSKAQECVMQLKGGEIRGKGNKARQGQHSDQHKASETRWDASCGQPPGKGCVALLCPSSSGRAALELFLLPGPGTAWGQG